MPSGNTKSLSLGQAPGPALPLCRTQTTITKTIIIGATTGGCPYKKRMEKIQQFKFNYTYEDYKQWEGRWELIHGIPYAMSPAPHPQHQRIVARVWSELSTNLTCPECEVFISPIDWKIDQKTVVQPDVAIFCEETNKPYFTRTPPLIVEVLSKSTVLNDFNIKFKLYEAQKVRHYIIIDPDKYIADIFELQNDRYQLQKKVVQKEILEFEWHSCQTKLNFGNIFI